jgi:hypothetical protein
MDGSSGSSVIMNPGETFALLEHHGLPVAVKTGRNMIAQVKGAAMLQGFRGKPPADTEVLSNILVAVSRLLAGDASIRNIDINPVIVGEKGTGCTIVDAKIEVTVAPTGKF